MDTKTPSTFATTHGAQMSDPPSAADKAQAKGNEALKDIVFGSFAGLVGKFVEYPFDTVKVRLQSQPDHLPLRYKGPLDCFKQALSHDGFRGLYRGVSAPLAGAAAETACLFWSYSVAKGLLCQTAFPVHDEKDLPLAALALAGAMSGGVTSLVLTPIELVKCRMQAPLHSSVDLSLRPGAIPTSTSLSPLTVVRDVFRREGLRGFWRGQFGTFVRETGGSSAWFGCNEATSIYLKKRIAKQQDKPVTDVKLELPQQLIAGAVAGVSYNFLFYPADTIKSKMQTGELTHVRPTFTSVGKELWKAHGLKGLYRGCGITCMRSAPSSALIFTIVSRLHDTFGPPKEVAR
ncbi:hypothetical protein LTR36_009871 [Oleoguttula mirabilis]|uniref:Uncharacterized protein n=1 Tax=Oleoguttula mirabilis TaxID=1507867 RepID=A0AAV9J5J6_9PEZI|nr:hypothetical protein LTR36_009871 [Oleoguttula mirabilis]